MFLSLCVSIRQYTASKITAIRAAVMVLSFYPLAYYSEGRWVVRVVHAVDRVQAGK